MVAVTDPEEQEAESVPVDESPRQRRKRERAERRARRKQERRLARMRRKERFEEALEEEDDHEGDAVSEDDGYGGESEASVETEARDPVGRREAAEDREEEALAMAEESDVDVDAERRVRAVEQIRQVAEARAAEVEFDSDDVPGPDEPEAPMVEAGLLEQELLATDEQIERRQRRDRELIDELSRTEHRIAENRARTEQALDEARQRVARLEEQAGEAEERATQAERLAELRHQEAERERRLHEMLDRINDAERQAREAESRARQAVADIYRPFDPGSALPVGLPPVPDPEPIRRLADSTRSSPPPAAPARRVEHPGPESPVNLNTATFEELRAAGLSVTQTGRVLAHRERNPGFRSVDELDGIPGFPSEFLETIRPHLTT